MLDSRRVLAPAPKVLQPKRAVAKRCSDQKLLWPKGAVAEKHHESRFYIIFL